MKPSLAWYWNRARAMSPSEIIHRARFEFQKRAWRKRLRQGGPKPAPAARWDSFSRKPNTLSLPAENAERTALLAEADKYLQHEWHFFGLSGAREKPIDWHADPTSGKIAPREFAYDINYRDASLVGNIKVIWEKNRHHHLSVLAVAYALTKDETYGGEIADQITDWVAQNPYLVGVNWSQPLEAGIRLISWVWCERLLRGSKHYDRAFGQTSPVWDSAYWHQKFIAAAYSRGSSANNHLIGEMAGLFIASTAWPVFEESGRWRDLSREILEQELQKQTFSSGINREMAFAYHIFSLEFFLLALAEAKRAGVDFPTEYKARLTKMIEAIPLLTDSGGNLPRYGDGDEGMAVQLQASGARRDAWFYRVGSAFLDANVPVPEGGVLAAALLGAEQIVESNWVAPKGSSAFEDAGIYVLASERGTPREVFVLADAGPHGYLSIAAHGHADALSFALSVGGKPILIDPGTYAYHTEEQWRSYFRSTRAHNTVVVDSLDQSTQAGPFLWTHKARTTVDGWSVTDAGARLIASHDGYARLGVVHQRTLQLEHQKLAVLDELKGSGRHVVTVCFHLAPECEVEQVSDSVLKVSRENVRVRMKLPDGLTVTLLRGEKEAGWYSPCFGVKVPTVSVVAQQQCSLPISLRTVVEVSF